MGICSDVFITRDEARSRVKSLLLNEQQQLIESAIKGMADSDLTRILNRDSELYYFNIDTSKKKKK